MEPVTGSETPLVLTRPAAPTPPDERPPRTVRAGTVARWVGLVAVLGLVAWIAVETRRPGHWWGDDWALYIRQANGLLDLHPGVVAQQNAFTVNNSVGAPFSPPIYPWGYPAVLALFIPILGDGVDRLAFISMGGAVIFAALWYRLARVRVGTIPALLGIIAVCFTPLLLSWVDLVQSEFVFMVAVGVFLVGLDSLVRSGNLLNLGPAASRLQWWWLRLVAIGIAAAFAFETRREGLATVAAIGAAQLAIVFDERRRLMSLGSAAQRGALAQLALPHIGFGVSMLWVRAVFPSVLVPRYDGAGIGNVWVYRNKHVAHFAELIGLKRTTLPTPTILGNSVAGQIAFWTWVAILVVGLVLCFTRWRRTDAHLAAYVIVAFVIGCSAKAALSRYFASVAPIASLIVLFTVFRLIRYPLRQSPRRAVIAATAVITVVLGLMTAANLVDARTRVESARVAREQNIITWGAQHPSAQEMFEFVRDNTVPGDIVASFKARVMVLETGRNAVQVDDYRPLNPNLEVALVVQEVSSRRAVEFFDDADWETVFINDRLVVFAPSDRVGPDGVLVVDPAASGAGDQSGE